MESLYNQKKIEIKNYLPHREPMLMVDIISAISADSVETQYVIPLESPFVKNRLLQEAGLIENAAQTCSAIVGQSYFFDENQNEITDAKVLGFISSIKKVEIFGLPKSESQIRTKAVLLSRFDAEDYSVCTMQVTTLLQDQCVLEAEINLFLQKQKQ